MSITTLPAAPNRNMPSATYVPTMDAWIAALALFTTEANATALAMNLNATTDTSVTSVLIGTGSKSFTVSTGKSFQIGMTLKIAQTATGTNWMLGDVTAYNSGTGALTVNVTSVAGSGTFAAWTISQSAYITTGGIPASDLQAQTYNAFISAGTAPTYTLTTSPVAAAYAAQQRYRVKFHAANSSAASTLNRDGLGVKNIYQYDVNGNKVNPVITVNQLADVEFDGTDFVILDPLPQPSITVVSLLRNGKMSVTAAGATATFTADEIVCETALGGTAYRLSSYSQAVNLATTGAGGMDTGAAPVSGFVSLYAIVKADGTKNILACNRTTSAGSIYSGANMPAGYIASALISIWPTNASSQFKRGYQIDRKIYIDTANALTITASVPTTFTSVSISSIVPNEARTWSGYGGANTSANPVVLAVAADSTGLAETISGMGVVGAANDSYFSGSSINDMPLITAQTFYYKAQVSTAQLRIDINAYTI